MRLNNRYTPLLDRFNAQWMPEPNSGCWLWVNKCQVSPKGDVRPIIRDEGRRQRAYRVAWKLHRGPIPDGMFVCHKCDVSICVNPDHLFLGTAADNAADMVRKGRHRAEGAPGSKNRHAVLTPDDVREIRSSADRPKDLAARYGVSRVAIWAARTGRTWSHLP